MNTSGLAKNVDSTVQSVLTLALATFGVKRGVERAAEMLGVSERWVRSFRFGGPARVSADTYLRALEARQALAAERAAQLRAEITELDQIARTRPDDEVSEAYGVLESVSSSVGRDAGLREWPRGNGLGHQTA